MGTATGAPCPQVRRQLGKKDTTIPSRRWREIIITTENVSRGHKHPLSLCFDRGREKKKKKSRHANPQQQRNTRREGFVPWPRCGLLEKQTQTNQFSQLIPSPMKAGGDVLLWREHVQRQTLNLGLKGTPAALLGLACSVGAAEQRFHQPGGSPLLVESNPVPQYWVCRDALRVW